MILGKNTWLFEQLSFYLSLSLSLSLSPYFSFFDNILIWMYKFWIYRAPCGISTKTEQNVGTQEELKISNSLKYGRYHHKRNAEQKSLEHQNAFRLSQWVSSSRLEVDHCDRKHRKISKKRKKDLTLKYPSDSRTFQPYVDQSTLKGYVRISFNTFVCILK